MQPYWLQFFYPMKYKYHLLFLFTFFFQNAFIAQNFDGQKKGILTPDQFSSLKEFLISKNLKIKDTIFIKYDFNKESCWNLLDGQGIEKIEMIKLRFQKHISDFNAQHKDAITYNFREPGNKINKLKLLDNTIVIDDLLFLKNLLFKNRKVCGTSAVILNDGSFLLNFGDAHFEILDLLYQKENKNF